MEHDPHDNPCGPWLRRLAQQTTVPPPSLDADELQARARIATLLAHRRLAAQRALGLSITLHALVAVTVAALATACLLLFPIPPVLAPTSNALVAAMPVWFLPLLLLAGLSLAAQRT